MGLAEHPCGCVRTVHCVDIPVYAGGDGRPRHGGAVLYGGQVRPGPGERGVWLLFPLLPGQL